MKKAMIIVNPTSGKEAGKDHASYLMDVLMDQYDSITLNLTHQGGDTKLWAAQSAAEHYDALYLVGGDGTINEGIDGIANKSYRPTVGIVPLGTFNNVSSMLGFPKNYKAAIRQFKRVHTARIDIGRVNNQCFISSIVTGILAGAMKKVNVVDKPHLGPFAYAHKALEAFGNDSTSRFKITADGVEYTREYSLIVGSIGNALLRMQHLFPETTIDDGYLNLVGMQGISVKEKLRLMRHVMNHGVTNDEPDIDYIRCQKCRIELVSDSPFEQAVVDGDIGPHLPLEIEVLPKHIEVFVPDNH
ncbi:diacylglycerol/lipid kinase family protein [Aerococcus suis]